MILSNPVKYFLLVLGFLTFCSGCRFCQNTTNTNTSPAPGIFSEDKSDLPFTTREPDIYQAEIVVVSGGEETRVFTARNGTKRRYEYGAGEKNALLLISTDKKYLVLPDKKLYSEEVNAKAFTSPSAWMEQLTTEWLNVRPGAKFAEMGKENGLTKFNARLDGSDTSEIVLFIDDNGLPVKQEYYSIAGERQDLVYTVELRNLRLEAADELFTVPKDFRKITEEELRKAMKTE
jgi:hypothetical protein